MCFDFYLWYVLCDRCEGWCVSVDDVWSRCSFVISFVIELLMAVQSALWYSSIFFFGLSCVSGWEEVAISIILGEAKIRSFTSSFPVTSLVYVGSLSLIFVYLCCSVYCTSNLPSLSAVSCPKFLCLQLKSPVMIVLICRVQMVLMISWDGFFRGQ